MMMEKIITLSGCINKEENIWKRKICTKFLIADARQMRLDEMSAKYQLFYLVLDTSEDDDIKTGPYVAIRCIDNVYVTLERFSVIGEPTFDTLLEWVKEYGNESLYKLEMDNFNKERLLKRKRKNNIEEKDYEVAFVWDDPFSEIN